MKIFENVIPISACIYGLSAEYVGFKFIVFNGPGVVGINYLKERIDELPLNGDSQLGNQVGDLINGQAVATVEVKVTENLLKKRWVVSGKLQNSRFDLSMQVLDSGLGNFSIIVLWNLPGGFHHSHEVLVTWGAHREIAIVVIELVPGYNAIIIASSAIEVVQEFSQDLVFGLLSLEEFWVHRNIVDPRDI